MQEKWVFTFLVLLSTTIPRSLTLISELFEWTEITPQYPDGKSYLDDLISGALDSTYIVPTDVDCSDDGRVFLAMPRNYGVPVTLGTISSRTGRGGHLVEAYPDWSWNNRTDCDGIFSAYGMMIKCNVLWVIDSGKNGSVAQCPPKVLAFDLDTNKLVKKIAIPKDVAVDRTGKGLMFKIVVDNPNCNSDNPTIYISDPEGQRLIVATNNETKALRANKFRSQGAFAGYTINGTSFTSHFGIMGIALTNSNPSQLYWTVFSRDLICVASTADILKSERTLIEHDYTCMDKLSHGMAAIVYTSKDQLVYTKVEDSSINNMDLHKSNKTRKEHVTSKNPTSLPFPCSIKELSKNGRICYIVLSNKYQNVLAGKRVNPKERNFVVTMFRAIDIPS